MVRDPYREEVIDPGDRASRLAKEICFESHSNCPALTIIPHQSSNFRGPVGRLWKKHILEPMMLGADNPLEDWVMLEEEENDGAGGKPQFFTLIGIPEVFRGLGWEIITMNADDIARSGRFPAVMVNEIQAKRITDGNFHLFQAMMKGYGEALRQARLVNITGEIAIMKHSITAFCDTGSDDQLILTWGGTCIGLAHRDLLIDNSKIKAGMSIVGFWEPGYRCNGGTFFTNVILAKWGSPLKKKFWQNEEMISFVKGLTVPSQSYAKTICRLIGWNPDGSIGKPLARIVGAAHSTGGGVWGKFGEILPPGVGAELYAMPKPAPILRRAQELSWDTEYRLTDWKAHSTLHGGCGMLLVCGNSDADVIIREAKRDGVEAMFVGETTMSSERRIIIRSQFKQGKILSSLEPE